jgi:SAM-dependent methyltransferase
MPTGPRRAVPQEPLRLAALLLGSMIVNIIEKMKGDWDRRAGHNPKFWIATEDWRTDEQFADSGQETARRLLALLSGRVRPGWRVLDIGCGIGRVLRALAPHVAHVSGVDVSGAMIEQSREWLRGVENAATYENSGIDLGRFEDASFDLVYSYVAFQHMPRPVMAAYVAESHRVLKPNGFLAFQIYLSDSAAEDPAFEDTLSLRVYRRSELTGMLGQCNFELVSAVCESRERSGLESWLVLTQRVGTAATADLSWLEADCRPGASPLDGPLYAALADGHLHDGRPDEARATLGEWAHAAPHDPGAWLALADLHVKCGDVDAALRSLEQGTAAVPGALELWLQMVTFRVESGDLEGAVRSARAWTLAQPGLELAGQTLEQLLCVTEGAASSQSC